jgi:hypothetical protein
MSFPRLACALDSRLASRAARGGESRIYGIRSIRVEPPRRAPHGRTRNGLRLQRRAALGSHRVRRAVMPTKRTPLKRQLHRRVSHLMPSAR